MHRYIVWRMFILDDSPKDWKSVFYCLLNYFQHVPEYRNSSMCSNTVASMSGLISIVVTPILVSPIVDIFAIPGAAPVFRFCMPYSLSVSNCPLCCKSKTASQLHVLSWAHKFIAAEKMQINDTLLAVLFFCCCFFLLLLFFSFFFSFSLRLRIFFFSVVHILTWFVKKLVELQGEYEDGSLNTLTVSGCLSWIFSLV